jgi:catechol 2,3-dioxygenase-like lactoylglutathione lyase family enzyme
VSPVELWVPVRVVDLVAATRFYTDTVGLSIVDSWDRGVDERGVVLRVADGAFVELAVTGADGPPPLAFRVGSDAEVDTAATRLGVGPPRRHPRGHYLVEATDPAGTPVAVWSER